MSGPKPKDLTGQRFGRLTAIRHLWSQRPRQYWLVRCDCGTECVAQARQMVRGYKKSCGCLYEETRKAPFNAGGRQKYDEACDSKSSEYKSWYAMHRRCTDERLHNYHRYGGRGISVCSEWSDFAAFVRDMGPKPTPNHTLDRIDNDGDYEPGNCRWATQQEQAANRPNYRAAAC